MENRFFMPQNPRFLPRKIKKSQQAVFSPAEIFLRASLINRKPCIRCCRITPCVTNFHSSIRAPLRHTQVDCLVLLPSDPDTVHRLMLCKTQTSSLLPKGRPSGHTSKADITLTIADCEYRAPLPPRLARKYLIHRNPKAPVDISK